MAFEEQDYKRAKSANSKKMSKWMRISIWVLAVVAVILVLGFGLSFFIDYVQIKEIGDQYTDIFWTNIRVKLIAQVVSLLLIFLLFMVNNIIIRRISWKEHHDLLIVSRLMPMVLITFIIAFIASRFISENVYNRFLTFANSTAFNRVDPVFMQDIGYYLFLRPFMMSLIDSIKAILIIQTIYTAGVYVIFQARNGLESFKNVFGNKGIVIHNIVNVLLVFLSIAMTFKFNAEEILYGSFSNLFGAGFTDIQVWAKYYNFAPYLLLAVLVATLAFLLRGKIKAGIISVAVFPASWVVTALIAAVVQTFVVAPNEVAVEAPNISNNIYMTREAYGLDKIIEQEFPIENTLTMEDLQQEQATIENIRISDFESTITAMNKLQGIKPYYTFKDADIVSYEIDGKPTAVSIGARELDTEKLAAETTDSYVNKTYKYTHGYGVAMNPINEVTAEGQPKFIIHDMPVESDAGVIDVANPRIYYGELTNDHVIVNTRLKEIDYPDGAGNVEFSYDGAGGINLNAWNRTLFSFIYGDYKMLVSGQITSESKILPNRNILQRVKKIAPFFEYDDDPYIIITDDGRLKWIIDGYATSEYFPYAQKTGKFNYIRNSVKAVVDAYDGTVDFYLTDENDPIAITYSKIYPTLFKQEPMPEDIRSHLRYPEYLFKIQAEMYKRYHITDAQVFYNGSDIWDIAKEKNGKNDTQYIEPYYNMMEITGFDEKGESLLLTMPFTIQNRDYVNAWLAAGSDDKYYGKLVLYRFTNAEKRAYGTMQMENRIDNDPYISSQMTLWGQGGSSVVRGNMIIVPIKDSLLYVEPVYITTQNTASFPEVKRVIVGYDESIVMENTLQDALNVLFNASDNTQTGTTQPPSDVVSPQPGENTGQPDELTAILGEIVELYGRYKEYNADNDFENAGKVMRDIDEYIAQAEQLMGIAPDNTTDETNITETPQP